MGKELGVAGDVFHSGSLAIVKKWGYIRGFSMVDVEDFLAKIRGTFHVKQFFERIGRNPLKARRKWSIMSAM